MNKIRLVDENLFAVSYDIYGYQQEIETFLFSSNQVDHQKASELREEYEEMFSTHSILETGDDTSFEQWLNQKGIWCMKIKQYRVEPIEIGQPKDYCVYSLEN